MKPKGRTFLKSKSLPIHDDGREPHQTRGLKRCACGFGTTKRLELGTRLASGRHIRNQHPYVNVSENPLN